MEELKTCTKCKEDYPCTEEFFYKQKFTTKKKGVFYKLTSECKACIKKRSNKWRDENPEKNGISNRRAARKFRENNLEKIRMSKQELRDRGYYRDWYNDNKDKARENRIKREETKSHIINKEEWENCKKYFNYRCTYCGLAIEEHFIKFKGKYILGDFHKEHVDDQGANDLSNCVPSCRSCNSTKHKRNLEEWYNEDNKVDCKGFNKDRLDKIIKWLECDYKLYIEVT